MGLPGTGKSTLSSVLQDRLQTLGIRVLSRAEQQKTIANEVLAQGRLSNWLGNIAYATAHRDLHLALAKYTTSFDPRYDPNALLYLKRFSRTLYLRQHTPPPNGITLLDQGTVQDLWSLSLLRKPGHRTHDLVVQSIARLQAMLPDVLVVIKASPETVRSRLLHRYATVGSLGLNEQLLRTSENDEIFIREGQFGDLIAEQVGLQGCVVIETDGAAPPQEQVEQVTKTLGVLPWFSEVSCAPNRWAGPA